MSTHQTLFIIKKLPHPSKGDTPEFVTNRYEEGSGQKAAKNVDKFFGRRKMSKILVGFVLPNGEFKNADLRPHWERAEEKARQENDLPQTN